LSNFYWRPNEAGLSTISSPNTGDQAIVGTVGGDSSFYEYNGSAWVLSSVITDDVTSNDLITKGPWIDPTHPDFGAVAGGDASANATALAAAFAYAEASNLPILIPTGTFAYNGPGLTYTVAGTTTGNGMVEGMGLSSILDYQGSGVALSINDDTGQGTGGHILRNFRITTSAGTPAGGLYLGGGSQYGLVSVDYVKVDSFDETDAYGIRIQKVVSSKINNSIFESNYYGLYTDNTADSYPTTVTFANSRFRTSVKHGAFIESGLGITFTNNCVFESNNGSGLKIVGTQSANPGGITISNNWFEANMIDEDGADYDIIVSGGGSGTPAVNVHISDNYFVGVKGGGNISYGYLWRLKVYRNKFSSTIAYAGGAKDVEWVHNNSGTQTAVTEHDNDNIDPHVYSAAGINLREIGDPEGTGTNYSTHSLRGSLASNSLPGNGSDNTAIALLTENATTGAVGGGLVLVSGWNSAKTKRFIDLVAFAYGATSTLHSYDAAGSPAARTYSVGSNITLNLQFANDGDTYSVRVSQLTN
jgi:hypothetical protein